MHPEITETRERKGTITRSNHHEYFIQFHHVKSILLNDIIVPGGHLAAEKNKINCYAGDNCYCRIASYANGGV